MKRTLRLAAALVLVTIIGSGSAPTTWGQAGISSGTIGSFTNVNPGSFSGVPEPTTVGILVIGGAVVATRALARRRRIASARA